MHYPIVIGHSDVKATITIITNVIPSTGVVLIDNELDFFSRKEIVIEALDVVKKEKTKYCCDGKQKKRGLF